MKRYIRWLTRKIQADTSLHFHESYAMIEFNHCFGLNLGSSRYELWLGLGREK
jgi:hypothetical protein